MKPLLYPRAKVIGVDADNVIWGGIVGEDGILGLKIGQDNPGRVYWRIQERLKALKNQGFLLVLLSKNNSRDVEEVFKSHPEMPLTLEDFVNLKINWEPKHVNLKSIASELGLSLDSFVFVDDSQTEQEEMAYWLPDVHILQATEEPLSILKAISNCDLFDQYATNAEDRKRSSDYHLEIERKKLEKKSPSVEDFLRSLELKAKVFHLKDEHIPRAVELIQKTNQFNLSTRRRSEAEIRRWCSDPRTISLTVSLSDRFGEQGIIGLLMAIPSHHKDTLVIDNFLISCRAIGRGVEKLLWSHFLEKAAKAGWKKILADYIPTAKNEPVAGLFESLGMKPLEKTNGACHFVMNLPVQFEAPPWIQVALEAGIG